MKRYKLVVTYDGTNYCGWQIQKTGITIEEILNKHLSQLLKEDIVVIGASRTDSGVHSLGNVAVFDSNTRIPGDKICYAINQRLPADIRVEESYEVPMNFHPRHCDTIKTYEYKILNRTMPSPVFRLYSYFVYRHLDVEAMQQAVRYIVGEHDFKSFCTKGSQVETTIRTIYTLLVYKDEEDMIHIKISGNGFLYNMVRIIVGTLVKVGLGDYSPEHVKDIVEAKDRSKAGPKVPPEGLTLVKIEYI